MKSTLTHRGPVIASDTLAATHLERNSGLTLGWSGRLIDGPCSLLEAYHRNGIAFIDALNGSFVIAIQDHDTLHVIRDPAGGRTVFYGRLGGRWLIAVEPKGIWSAPGFSRRMRPAAVAQYFAFSFVPGSGTMLEDLWELPAGHRVELRAGAEPRLIRHFAFEHLDSQTVPIENSPQHFRALLEKEVACRMAGGSAPAVLLSGGLDSSVVTAELAAQSARPVRTYAIHFGKRYPNELEYARAVADHCGTEHREIEIRPRDAVRRLRQMVWHLDDPIGDPITAPNFEMASRLSAETHELFNGEGGDPLFGGPKNIPMLMHHWYGGVDHAPGFRERRYLATYRRGYEELGHVLTPEFRTHLDPQRDLESLLTPFFQVPGPFLHKLLAINTRLKGAHLILPKVERMLGAWGVTPLSPMFTASMVRLSFQTPPQAKLRQGIEKWMIKEAYRDRLPQHIVDRPKSGMRVPVHYWFSGALKRYARKVLNPRRLCEAGIFDPKRVRQWLRYDIEEGPGRYGLRIWMLLTFETWRRIVIEGEKL
jgi:asparagine synthase (glutamine-hydrolysing)